MEAPKSIYLQVCGDCPLTDCDNCKFNEDGVTWSIDRIFPKDVEYVRKDVLEDALHYVMHSPSEVSDLQAAMNIAVMKAYNAGKEELNQQMLSHSIGRIVRLDSDGKAYIDVTDIFGERRQVDDGDQIKVTIIKED